MPKPKPTEGEIREKLWNEGMAVGKYASDADGRYQTAILEQYKLYVEMADRISNRRGLTNTFFLTLNTIVFTLFGVFWKDRPANIPLWVIVMVTLVLLGQTAVWWLLVLSYRQLNSGKYQVVGLLEERLPASPYWSAEWRALGEGKDPRLYLPLSHVEQWVPTLFALVYIISGVLVATS